MADSSHASGPLAATAAVPAVSWFEQLKALPNGFERELAQLKKRYGDSCTVTREGTPRAEGEAPVVVDLKFRPSDPDFPFDLPNGVHLAVSLPKGNLVSECEIWIHNDDIAPGLRSHVETAWKEEWQRVLTTVVTDSGCGRVRATLKWLDNSFTALMQAALAQQQQQQQQQQQKQKQNINVPPSKPLSATASSFTTTAAAAGNSKADTAKAEKEKTAGATKAETKQPGTNGGAGGNDNGDGTEMVPDWSMQQQRALEEALAKFPSSIPSAERWASIGDYVPGKTKSQCVKRFKEIRQAIVQAQQEKERRQAAKAAAAAAKAAAAVTEASGAGGAGAGGAGEEEEEEAPLEAPKLSLNPDFKGTAIKLDGMLLDGVGVVRLQSIQVQIECTRCQHCADIEVTDNADDPVSMYCAQCKVLMGASLRPEMAHSHNKCAGYLDLLECVAKDYLPTRWTVSCFECSHEMLTTPLLRASRWGGNCHKCHEGMSFGFNVVKLNPVQTQVKHNVGSGKGGHGSGKGFEKRGKGELPDKGRCKHYRKSYRWLRFPCCGKAFPCDICHEESEGNSHEMIWANRQICGFCGSEQAFAKEGECKACGGKPTGRSGGAHWEGGQGCRDKTKMSSKDNKKHSDSVFKTKSKKAERVGQKKK